jgi:uncharacterized membrane protein YqiK
MASGEDANPLNRRLPAEVVSRRKQVKKVEEKPNDDVQVDLKTALNLKPEARIKWLTKAFKMVDDKRASSTDLYDIISNRKFCSTMQAKNHQKVRTIVLDSVQLFSDKQQRFLRSDEWVPNKGNDEEEEGKAAAEREDAEKADAADSKSTEAREKDREGRERKEEGAGGWTWTVVERSTPDVQNRRTQDAAEKARRERLEKERRKAEAEEAAKKALHEAEQAKQRQQAEEEVDSSILMLERLNQQKQHAPEPSRQEKDKKRRHGLSRSRSISAGSVSSSSRGRSRKGRGRDRKRKRSRDRGGSGSFEEALRRRMQQRESEIDSARMPVVDPGHARKVWR